MSRALVVSLVLAAATASPAEAARNVLREQARETIPVKGLTSVRVENSRGDVELGPSADDQIHLTAFKLVRSGSSEESRRLSDQIRVDAGVESGEYVVRVRYPREQSIRIGFWDLFRDFEVPSSEVRIGLQLPAALAASARTVSGDIRSSGLAAAQTLVSTSGDVEVSDAGGAVRVETSTGDVSARMLGRASIRTGSGDVELEGARGPAEVHTTSGDLSVSAAADSLDLGTVTGDIQVDSAPHGLVVGTTSGEVVVRRAAGRIEVGASSGDVDLRLVAPLGSVDVTTSSGDIDVRLASGVGGTLELRTSNGSLQLDSPIVVSNLTRRLVTGRILDGKAPIVLRSASGDIHVYTGEKGS